MVGLCGPKEDHICIPHYKSTVGDGEVEYNKMANLFRFKKVGGFARVIVVNQMHPKLLQLVLVACCTCRRFYSN